MQPDSTAIAARAEQEQITQRRAQVLGMRYVDTSRLPNKQLFRQILPVPELYRLKMVPLTADPSNILFGILTTTPQPAMAEVKQRFLDQIVTFAIISDAGYHEYMALYDPPKKVAYQDITLKTAGTAELVRSVSASLAQVRADDLLAYLVAQAHRLGASDIHVETQAEDVRIRFRIDGVLHPIARLTPDKYRVLVAAVASAGNVSTSSAEAQQGHIEQTVQMADGNAVDVNVRLETVPTVNGMDMVMRLFNMRPEMFQLDNLGLSPGERKVVDSIISKPSGLVMVVGPTGSGKTTTLYSIMNSLNSEERKIITVEDPVEYQFPGITQIPVPPSATGDGHSFADKLRAVLRLDPDVIMVGEVRDNDTARTALQAALTGHLVLTTFHASSAAATLTRLNDVIGQNPLFVGAIRLIMAQRLARRLDDATKQPYQPDAATLTKLQEVITGLPNGVARPSLQSITLYKPGSSPDNPYGYRGQLVIREQMQMSPAVLAALQTPSLQVTSEAIQQRAVADGMVTMQQDGVLKALQGLTTLEEVYRVVDY
ncbi:MAG TPA: ATPase, T2SS/T4P/T4SS family [Candidatus Saccharimonadales bacterium]|nr:ATPase, T2SS/T4P/T4SS family [Candidatus Saccharimonadales bacterium]